MGLNIWNFFYIPTDVPFSGYDDLKSEIALLYKHPLNEKNNNFFYAGLVTEFPNFSCLTTRWRCPGSGGQGCCWQVTVPLGEATNC